ncbi:MAG: hypothetical protein ACRENX_05805 [Candidatus Dormibacteria bacterium]
MSTPLSIRFDPAILETLRRRARAIPGAMTSGLAQGFLDGWLRMAEHRGIMFKDGATRRRAALLLGPDVWEFAKFARELHDRARRGWGWGDSTCEPNSRPHWLSVRL